MTIVTVRKMWRDNEVTQDALELVDVPVPLPIVAGWTDEQALEATAWAAAMMGSIRNANPPPTLPEFLRPYRDKNSRHYRRPEVLPAPAVARQ